MSRSIATSVFALPEFHLGAYSFKVIDKAFANCGDGRKSAVTDWNTGTFYISSACSQEQQTNLFIKSLLTAIHFIAGVNDTCDEEVYTQSLASGLTALAKSQPHFWQCFLELINATASVGPRWLNTQAYPDKIYFKGRTCPIEKVSREYCERQQVFGLYFLGGQLIELSEELRGTNLATVALHEGFHFMHDSIGLQDGDGLDKFLNLQSKHVAGFIRENTEFFSWWGAVLWEAAQRNPAPLKLKRAA